MFYVEPNEYIHNIIQNMYMDSHENKFDTVFLKNISQDEIDKFNDFISCIIKTTNPLSINILQKGNDYFHNVTMKEILDIEELIPGIKSNKLRTEYGKDFSRILKQYPKALCSDYNKKIKQNVGKYINNRDSVLYLSDIVSLDRDIELSLKSNMFEIEELRKLYSMTIRLILPKYMIDKIKAKHKVTYIHKSDSGKIMCSLMNKTHKKLTDLADHITYVGKNYQKLNETYPDILPGFILHKVYLNVTFEELSNIINELAPLEEEYAGQVIGAIYYNLLNYVNIKKLFDIDKKVESGIIERMYYRRGN